ncbi:YajG family lipoprotein [Reinekea blandensis]|uniref:Lipoprotein, putative n=1 Tax=Reinekea blandensis MED297 TaxID=314283 RepID=A4BIQ5_9GAMM|nr:YajG family lipoprotein [Reinekea blandensis]EAR08019.1 lipoprotein, putative [Reinekea sp. MED297] [Reinekea blandensis MED297]
MRDSVRVLTRWVMLLSVVWVFVGCAQLSPQQVRFSPSLETDQLITGNGTASLIVEDKRADKVIGHRGGVYEDTSVIVPERPLTAVIEEMALQVMAQAGVEISTAFPDYDVAIQLDKLSYMTENRNASIKRTTAAAAISIRVRRDNTTFENGYSTTQYIETVGYPSEEKNEELLNNVFESVLQRMFSDPELDVFIE